MAATTVDLFAHLVARERAQRARRELLRSAVYGRLVAVFEALPPGLRPARAFLFGSLTWGGFDERSDVDVMVFGLSAEAGAELCAHVWDAIGRPVHLVRAETAEARLVARVGAEGEELHVA